MAHEHHGLHVAIAGVPPTTEKLCAAAIEVVCLDREGGEEEGEEEGVGDHRKQQEGRKERMSGRKQ